MRASWTRDEVILGLDVLYTCKNVPLRMDNPSIVDLSQLLNRLPIIDERQKEETFRNIAGVRRQLLTFEWGLRKEIPDPHVGETFFKVYDEFKDRFKELHEVAQAIRRCEVVLASMMFGADIENNGFPEGAILAHLHRIWEKEHGRKYLQSVQECEICAIRPQYIYNGGETISFLEKHLLVPPVEYGADIKFKKEDFIAVCPNCHSVLHQTRPWVGREQCEHILMTLEQR